LSMNGVCVVSLDCGEAHTIALTDRGFVYTWGNGDFGKLGLGDTSIRFVPYKVDDLKASREGRPARVVSVSAGAQHSAAVTDEGVLFMWGCGTDGRLGQGNENHFRIPAVVEALQDAGERVTTVSCGSHHTACTTCKLCR
jgi:alpha-tubulin suppressor-like RCC1 family protein